MLCGERQVGGSISADLILTSLHQLFPRPASGRPISPSCTRIGLTACDCVIYVSLPAKLEHISADTITDESGESVFLIRVRT